MCCVLCAGMVARCSCPRGPRASPLAGDGRLLVLAARPRQAEAVAQLWCRGIPSGTGRARRSSGVTCSTNSSRPVGKTSKFRLKPSAARVVNQYSMLSATCSGVPTICRCAPPLLSSTSRTVQPFFAGELHGRLEEPAGALDAARVGEPVVGDLLVKRQVLRVHAELPGQAMQLAVQVEQCVKLVLAGPCFRLGGTDDRVQARQDDQMVGIAAVSRRRGPACRRRTRARPRTRSAR